MASVIHEVALEEQEESFTVEADDVENDSIHIVEADDSDEESLVVSLDDEDDEESKIQASSELWTTPNDFLQYVRKAAEHDAKVNKRSVNTLRTSIAYLQDVQREIIRTATSIDAFADFNSKQLAELDRLEEHIERDILELNAALEQLENKRKQAILSDLTTRGLIKKAWKAADITLTADPFIYGIARLCINAKVANGKNIEEVFDSLAEHYKLDDREKFAVAILMRDSGYPIRGSLVGDIDQITQYFG